jgi:biopolymer transport protein ExbB
MGILASVGSVAPSWGSLGTVIGIINAFEGSRRERQRIGSVAGGIAEALVVTAIGLAVAIPAVLLFNYLNGRVEAMMLVLKTAAGEMTDAMTLGSHARPSREEVPSRVPPILAPLNAAMENSPC